MFYSEIFHLSSKGLKITDKHGNSLTTDEALKRVFVRFYNWWLDLRLLLINTAGFCPFWFFRSFVYSLGGLKIGKRSKIHVFCRFFEPRRISIGEDSLIGESAFLDGRAKLVIGDHVDIASQVLIYNSEHDIESEDFCAVEAPVEIGDYVFIGPRAVILPGVKIGNGAVVAAGGVVTHDVAPYKVVAGVPAREIGERHNKDLHYRLGRRRLFQ